MVARIIIFGAAMRPDGTPSQAMRRRVAAAVDFAAGHADAILIPTGGQGRHGPAEWQAMVALLRAAGVPCARIRAEPTALDTLDSVLACRLLLDSEAGPVFVATSRFHLPRCLILLRLAGIAAQPVPIGPSTERIWWRRWYWRLREVPALAWDVGLLIRWRLRGRPPHAPSARG